MPRLFGLSKETLEDFRDKRKLELNFFSSSSKSHNLLKKIYKQSQQKKESEKKISIKLEIQRRHRMIKEVKYFKSIRMIHCVR